MESSPEIVATPAEPKEPPPAPPTRPAGRSRGLREMLQQKTASWEERLRIAIDPTSSVAESFRKLRTHILHSFEQGDVRSILVTSSLPEEGKGMVTTNLGVAVAKGLERYALLVDCDLRKPTLDKLLALPSDRGLANFLQGEGEIADYFCKTGLPKLNCIPCGPKPENPAELLDTEKAKRLFAELSTRYNDRLTIIDSPPLLVAAETAVLATYADAILMVVRWGVSGKEQVKQALDLVDRKKVIGVVFNAFEETFLDRKLQSKGYYGYYGGKYHYGGKY